MKNWWRTDKGLIKNWQRTDEELMKNWWRTDEERMKSWCRADAELMKSWWRADEELTKNWRRMNWWWTDDELMMNWWWTDYEQMTNYQLPPRSLGGILRYLRYICNFYTQHFHSVRDEQPPRLLKRKLIFWVYYPLVPHFKCCPSYIQDHMHIACTQTFLQRTVLKWCSPGQTVRRGWGNCEKAVDAAILCPPVSMWIP